MTTRDTLTSNVYHCARCGYNHTQITFRAFAQPITDDNGTMWRYWGMCPISGDPILMTKELLYKAEPNPVKLAVSASVAAQMIKQYGLSEDDFIITKKDVPHDRT